MNIKLFRQICKVSSILLKGVAVYMAIVIVIGLYGYFFTDRTIWFNLNMPSFPILHSVRNSPTESQKQLAALIEVPFATTLGIYIYWKGSQLFNYLAKGQSPFSFEFSRSIKRLALLMIISDIILPLFRSLMVTTLMENGYYFLVGVNASLMIGLILYAVSEIFNYGIELQRLSDETV